MVECPHAEHCGGCALIGLSRDQQHSHKRARVEHALAPYPPLAGVQFGSIVAADPQVGYRTRAKLVVSVRGEIGLYGRGGHAVVDIPECRVLSPLLLSVVAELRGTLGDAPAITGLDVREVRDGSRDGVLVTLIGSPRERRRVEALAERVARHPNVLGVAFSARDSDSAQLLGATPESLSGESLARDRLGDGPYFYAAHGGFAQAHRGQATRIAHEVVTKLTASLGTLRGARILELYAGSGALGLRLAELGAKPTLVERFEPALLQASRAAREQGLPEFPAHAQDAETALQALMSAGAVFDAVVVNPPRRGLPARVRTLLCRLAPRQLVYVSCEPATLARDLADFARQGLAARELTPYDMLPLAADVESLVSLEPAPPALPAVLYEDDALLAVDKPPHVPTIPHREHARSLLELLQERRGLPELRAVHRLDLGTSGVCLFAKTREAASTVAAALSAGQKHYLALARGRVHDKGVIKKPLSDGGRLREALTRYARKQTLGGHSLVRVRPAEGRTHQVRKHLAAIGHPVLGDSRYGDAASNRYFEHKHGLDRTFLHLHRVELPGDLVIEAGMAPDLDAVMRSLAGGC